MKYVSMAAIALVTLMSFVTQASASDCVPQSVLAEARTAAGETWRASSHVTRWSRVLAGFGESNGHTPMTVAEAQAQVDRGLQRWVPIHAALSCLANPPQVEVEVQPAVEEVDAQPTVNVVPEQTSLNLPTYPAPTAHSGWFGWNAPNQIRRVSGSGPVPAQCKAKAGKVRQEIIDSDWHISTMAQALVRAAHGPPELVVQHRQEHKLQCAAVVGRPGRLRQMRGHRRPDRL